MAVVLGLPTESAKVCRAAELVYKNFGRTCVDLLYEIQSPRLPIPTNIHFENLKLLDEAVAAGRGVILLGAHSGSWELGALALASRGYSIMAPVQAPAGKWVSVLYHRERSRFGLHALHPGQSLIKCIKALKSGGILGLLGDRKFESAAIRTNFMGRPADLPVGPARMALMSGAAVVSVSIRSDSTQGSYRLKFHEKKTYSKKPGDDKTEELQCWITGQLEMLIKEAPEQWFCFENVWGSGTRPVK
jgi:KDO2-lipid IV(A) lauroyltransferase